MRIGTIATSSAAIALVVSLGAPAWSQIANDSAPRAPSTGLSNVSDRFEAGEFGEPHDIMRPETAAVMANLRDPAEAYVYYVVPCDTPGAIRSGSPAALIPGAVEEDLAADPGDAVCVVLVDESRTDGAPLLYSYDSPYRYPAGYPTHHKSSEYTETYVGSANVGIYAGRAYGPRRHGGIGYGVGNYGPYPDGAYASTPYSNNAGPYGPHPWGTPYYEPYGFGAYPFGANYYGVTHLGPGRYGARRFGSGRYRDPNYGGWNLSNDFYSVPNGRAGRRGPRE